MLCCVLDYEGVKVIELLINLFIKEYISKRDLREERQGIYEQILAMGLYGKEAMIPERKK